MMQKLSNVSWHDNAGTVSHYVDKEPCIVVGSDERQFPLKKKSLIGIQ